MCGVWCVVERAGFVLMQCGGASRVPHQPIRMDLQEALSTINKTK